jgi:hypothetical protein
MFGSRIASTISGIAAAAVLLTAGLAQAEKVKNPEYENWAKFKAGAMSKTETNTEAMGNKTKITSVTKLVEINAEKALIESTVTMEVAGQKMEQPVMKREVPATMEKPAEQTPPTSVAPTVKPNIKEGEETVTVAGKELKCKTTESTSESNGMKVQTKTWTSADVPGQIVKTETKTTGAMESSTTMQLVEFSTGG